MTDDTTYDVALIGGGAAGLQAAQTLGRMHRRTIVFDTGRYRNDPAAHMHNFLGHDGTPPAELRAAAHRDAEAYADVEFRDAAVTKVSGTLGQFTIEAAGQAPVRARRVLLASGVRDTLPAVPGVAENFGDLVAHCPFCHGHEFAGTRVGVLGVAAHTPMFAAMVLPIAREIVVLTQGAAVDTETSAALDALGVTVRANPVSAVRRAGDGLTVEFDGADPLALGGMFVTTAWAQSTPFAAELGLEMSELGAVLVDASGRTSVPGVYAAGDMAQSRAAQMPLAAVLVAAASGLVAAATCVQDDAFEQVAALP